MTRKTVVIRALNTEELIAKYEQCEFDMPHHHKIDTRSRKYDGSCIECDQEPCTTPNGVVLFYGPRFDGAHTL